MFGADTAGDLRHLDGLWARLERLTRERVPWERGYQQIVPLYALLGKPARARAMLSSLRTDVAKVGSPAVAFDARMLLYGSFVEAGSGNMTAADSLVRSACALLVNAFAACATVSIVELLLVADKAVHTDSSLAVYQRFTSLRSMRYIALREWLDQTTPLVAPALRHTGELLDAKADTLGAVDAYMQFVRYWEHADAPLRPVVRRVRQRISQLQRAAHAERRAPVGKP